MGQPARVTLSVLVLAASLVVGVHDRATMSPDRTAQPAATGAVLGRVAPVNFNPAESAGTRAAGAGDYDVDAAGFAPSAVIDLELTNSSWQGSARANPAGRVRVRFVVPAGLAPGSYVLSLTGPRAAAADPADQVGRTAAAVTASSAGPSRVDLIRIAVT